MVSANQPGALQLGTLSEPKKKNINELMTKFDDVQSESVLAANLEREGAAKIVIQRMSAKIAKVVKERSASRVSTVGVVRLRLNDVVGALRLYQTFVKDEVAACDEYLSMNNIVILKKVLIN